MTIDEAIKHSEEMSQLNEECARIYSEHGKTMESYTCKECASEHQQLAEWLRELKKYRAIFERIPLPKPYKAESDAKNDDLY